LKVEQLNTLKLLQKVRGLKPLNLLNSYLGK
jgi:hypothetical protein